MEGQIKVRNLLKTNLSIKIISVLAAILFWIIVFNTENPFLGKKIAVPIVVINEQTLIERKLELIGEIPATVDVYVRGRGDSTNAITGNDFKILLDLSVIDSADITRLKLPMPESDVKDVYVERMEKDYVEIKLERIISKEFPINIKVTGIPKDDYTVLEYSSEPKSYTITGLESVINEVQYLEAAVDVNEISGTLDVERACAAYDDKNQALAFFTGINVKIKVEVGKEIPVIPSVTGIPAEGYVITTQIAEPNKFLVSGHKSLLDRLTELVTEQVSIEGMSEDVSFETSVVLPEGITLENSENLVKVSVSLEEMTERVWEIDKNTIQLLNKNTTQNYNYQILSDTVKVVVKGRNVDIAQLKLSDIKLSADMSNMGEGLHGVPINVAVPSGYTFVSADSIQIKIEKLKSLTLRSQDIEIISKRPEYIYSITDSSIDVVLLGYSSTLQQVTLASLQPHINALAYGPGLHVAEVKVTLPAGEVKIVGKLTVLLNVTAVPATTPTEPGTEG